MSPSIEFCSIGFDDEQHSQGDPIVAMDTEKTADESDADTVNMADFINEFGEGLLEKLSTSHTPVYNDDPDPAREAVMDALKRSPFPAQRRVVQAVSRLLIDRNETCAVMNCEMGTGKTMMAIAQACVMHATGYRRFLVLAPPHLVFKWRREILETVDNAKVWVLNGPDTLAKLIALRETLGVPAHDGPEFFILGRVRMRMGFHWRTAITTKCRYERCFVDTDDETSASTLVTRHYARCPQCGTVLSDDEGGWIRIDDVPRDKRLFCRAVDPHTGKPCNSPLWTLKRPRGPSKSRSELVSDAMRQIPTIGPKTAGKLIDTFGAAFLASMLEDNIYGFLNLMDENGELVFSDKQYRRMERAMANLEISFGQGGYQPTEFIKRYLPNRFFSAMYVDEGHEYKAEGSAQGQAMGVLCSKVEKVVLLTGTLMGGYATDLFYLLFRMMPTRMVADGYRFNGRGTLSTAAMHFMQQHGVLKEVITVDEGDAHKTARGKQSKVRTKKAPGFGPMGIVQYVLPYTVFLKLSDIGQGVLPAYNEHLVNVPMSDEQRERYDKMTTTLTAEMRAALAKGDTTLLGVVMSALLRWPDTCFREENVVHPRRRNTLFYADSLFGEDELSPKESLLIDRCLTEKRAGRRTLVFTTYTGKHDTASRLKTQLTANGLKVAVLRSTVDTSKREDWVFDQVDRGIDVLICNPELVKTGLDLLEFPTIVFMQTAYNVYTVQQAARRSWRIGQMHPVDVYFFGYEDSAQSACLSLMASKIAVAQSTSGDIPESGLDALNQDNDESLEVALARKLAA